MTDTIRDVYSRITGKIIADLEQGVRPWMKPWNAEHAAGRITRPLRHNGIPYKGINVVMLWSASVTKGYACSDLAHLQAGAGTRRPCAQGRARRACRLCRPHHPHRDRRQGRGDRTRNPVPERLHRVQCRAVRKPARALHRDGRAPCPTPLQRIDARRPVLCRHRRRHPPWRQPRLLRRRSDHVQMPPFETFRDAESYAATLAHELTHWTKHEKRLARDFGRMRWGDEGYAEGGTGRRTRRRLPLRRSRDHAGGSRAITPPISRHG